MSTTATTSETTLTAAPRITKRKLDDAISILDSAFSEKASALPNGEEGPPRAKRRALGKSLYATLAKYGFKSSDSPPKEKLASARTPRLTALLEKNKSATAPASSSTNAKSIGVPITISSPQALVARPPFRPTSAPDFLARLSTFKLTTYRDKPRQIDAVVAARCGWRNDGLDRLVCDYCSATWVVGSTTGMAREAANTLTERHRVSMVNAHKESCPWRIRQCDESIYRVPIKGSTIMAREVHSAALALSPLVKDVVIKHPLTTAQVAHLESTILSVAPEESSTPSSDPPPSPLAPTKPSETSLILALFGWQLHISSERKTALLPGALQRSSSGPGHSRSSSGGSAPVRTTASLSSAAASRVKARHSFDGAPGSAASTRPSTPTGSPMLSSMPLADGHHHSSSGADTSTVIACALCQRRVGVWGFRASSSSSPAQPGARSASGGSGGTTDTSLTVPSIASSSPRHPPQPVQRVLDVVKEHRSYCPYIVRSTPLPTFSFSMSPGGSASATTSPNATPRTSHYATQQRPMSAGSSSAVATQSFSLTRVFSHPESSTSQPATFPSLSSAATATAANNEQNQLVEGWKAVLSVVGRAGMGRRRRMSRRRRSDQVGMEIRLAADAVLEDEDEEESSGPEGETSAAATAANGNGNGHGSPNGSAKLKKKRSVRIRENRPREEDAEMDEQARKVDEMVDSVKRGGGVELLRYVKGLLG